MRGRPQALDGASELTQAVLVDPLVHDVQTLATINSILAHRDPDGAARTGMHKRVPYIFIAPERPQEIGAIAAHVYRERFGGLRDAVSAPSLALLGRAFGAGDSPARGELFSYLFFAREFAEALMLRGRADAERWLSRRHDDGPWRLRKPAAR
jgi:NTE family protein